jgi:Ser/Thr protein kinase RdoA (MazF antagonist)
MPAMGSLDQGLVRTAEDELLRLLLVPPPRFDVSEVARIAAERYGVAGSLRPLYAERDQNFHLSTAANEEFTFKIANAAEGIAVLDLQCRALLAIGEQDTDLPVPRVCRTREGELVHVERCGTDRFGMRLLTFLPGEPLAQRPGTAALRREVGRLCAQLGRALRGYTHPRADHKLIWDIQHADDGLNLNEHQADPDRRRMVERVHRAFREMVAPQMRHLRAQVIHNDFNGSNILVDPAHPDRVSGIIDFGDLVRAPLIIDLAVAVAHQLRHQPDPIAAACDVVAAYDAVTPLAEDEIGILFDLVCTRIAMGATIRSWRRQVMPENCNYDPERDQSLWAVLDRLLSIDRGAAVHAFRAACRSGGP